MFYYWINLPVFRYMLGILEKMYLCNSEQCILGLQLVNVVFIFSLDWLPVMLSFFVIYQL